MLPFLDDRESIRQFALVIGATILALMVQFRGYLLSDSVVSVFENGEHFFDKHCQYVTLRPTRTVVVGRHLATYADALAVQCPPRPPMTRRTGNASTG